MDGTQSGSTDVRVVKARLLSRGGGHTGRAEIKVGNSVRHVSVYGDGRELPAIDSEINLEIDERNPNRVKRWIPVD